MKKKSFESFISKNVCVVSQRDQLILDWTNANRAVRDLTIKNHLSCLSEHQKR